MYCPNCGVENDDGQQYCARCGARIDVVADILRGRFPEPVEIDERLVGLLKDVYRGRRGALAGGIVTIVALAKLAPILVFGLASLTAIAVLLLPFLLAGLTFLVWGLTKWNNASSEIRAIKQVAATAFPVRGESRAIARGLNSLDTKGDLPAQTRLRDADIKRE